MNASLLNTLPWTFLLGSLALTSLAWIIGRRLPSPVWQRLLWRLALAGYLLLAGLEMSGSAHWVVAQARAMSQAPSGHGTPRFDIVTDLTPDARFVENALATQRAIRFTRPDNAESAMPGVATWLFLVWFTGAAGMLGLLAWRRLALQWLSHRASEPDDPALLARFDSLRRRLGIRRSVRLRLSPLVRTPVAWGVLRPTVCLPQLPTQPCTEPQRDVMLSHELAHLSAHDPFWYSLADMVTALFWWHPLVWWMRRRLRDASEEAADEASLLVDNGPGTLAEYLVLLGRNLAAASQPACLGMAGDGYRSALTRRVERLLHLQGAGSRPLQRTRTLPATLAGALFILSIGLGGAAWSRDDGSLPLSAADAWRQSRLHLAMTTLWPQAAPPRGLTPGALSRGNPSPPLDAVIGPRTETEYLKEVSDHIDLGRLYFDQGRWSNAEHEFASAYRQDPANATALDYLVRIEQARTTPATPTERMYRRWWNVPPMAIAKLIGDPDMEREAALMDGPIALALPMRQEDGLTFIESFKDHLKAYDLDMNQPGRSLFYADRRRQLMAQATLTELDRIEQALRDLNPPPPQVVIEMMICEIFEGPDITQPGPGTRTGVLTIPQHRVTRRSLDEGQEGQKIDILTAPRVTTLSGRQAQVKTVEIRHLLEGTSQDGDPNAAPTNRIEVGPTIDVVPEVMADGITISLKVMAWVNEMWVADPGTPEARQLVRRRYQMSHALVFDRQTMVLGDFTDVVMPATYASEHPGILKDPPASLAPPKPTRLVIHVTPTLIDSAGNALHNDADPGHNLDRIPPQPEPPALLRPDN